MRSTFRCILCFVLVPALAHFATAAVPASGTPRQAKPYHGMRIMPAKIDFYVWKITTAEQDSKNITIDISFSRAVDPRTMSPQMIYSGNTPLPANTRIQYSRAGTACRFLLSGTTLPQQPFTIQFTTVKSIDGRMLLQKTFTGITTPSSILFSKPAS